MNRLPSLVFTFLGVATALIGQATGEILLQPIGSISLPESLPEFEGSLCVYRLAPPDGGGAVGEIILSVPGIPKPEIRLRVNGELMKLKFSPKSRRSKRVGDYSAAWSNGKVVLELDCHQTDQDDIGLGVKGFIEIRIGKSKKRFKVVGRCGC